MSRLDAPLSHAEAVDLAPLFVLGALEPDEAAAVRAHLAGCREPHPELDELGDVVPYLLEDVEPLEPSAGLRDRILAAAAADLEARTGRAAGAVAEVPGRRPGEAPAPADSGRGPVIDAATRFRPTALSRSVDWAFRIAAVVAILALVGWNVSLQGRVDEAEAARRDLAAVVELAAQEGSLSAVLTGSDVAGLAAVAPDGTVRLALAGLEPISGSEVYTAWAITGEGAAPVPIGDLQLTGAGAGSLATTIPDPVPGLTLALTREPRPGARTPTLPIVAAGSAA